MCGRFTLTADPEVIQHQFNLDHLPEIMPRYNVAPSQAIAVITNQAPKMLSFYRWGLVPRWAKDPAIGNRMINARSETAHEKPSFKSALKSRRCLIPANGFYEWAEKGTPPVYIHLNDHALFAFAGLWETWQSPEGEEIRTCTILTTDTNDLVQKYHHRMPVILSQEDYATWLAPDDLAPSETMPLLKPYPSPSMDAYQVSTLVNKPANDNPECIQPLVNPDQPTLL